MSSLKLKPGDVLVHYLKKIIGKLEKGKMLDINEMTLIYLDTLFAEVQDMRKEVNSELGSIRREVQGELDDMRKEVREVLEERLGRIERRLAEMEERLSTLERLVREALAASRS